MQIAAMYIQVSSCSKRAWANLRTDGHLVRLTWTRCDLRAAILSSSSRNASRLTTHAICCGRLTPIALCACIRAVYGALNMLAA
jgi:hypothetical protein